VGNFCEQNEQCIKENVLCVLSGVGNDIDTQKTKNMFRVVSGVGNDVGAFKEKNNKNTIVGFPVWETTQLHSKKKTTKIILDGNSVVSGVGNDWH